MNFNLGIQEKLLLKEYKTSIFPSNKHMTDSLLICNFCTNSKCDFGYAEPAEQFQVGNLYKTIKPTKNWFTDFGLFEEINNLSQILIPI